MQGKRAIRVFESLKFYYICDIYSRYELHGWDISYPSWIYILKETSYAKWNSFLDIFHSVLHKMQPNAEYATNNSWHHTWQWYVLTSIKHRHKLGVHSNNTQLTFCVGSCFHYIWTPQVIACIPNSVLIKPTVSLLPPDTHQQHYFFMFFAMAVNDAWL